MTVLQDKQRVEWDPEARRWQGDWFLPQLGKDYQVPPNASNHPEHRGRVGECIGRRTSQFGMTWALMRFYDHRIAAPKKDWIRTIHLIESEGS